MDGLTVSALVLLLCGFAASQRFVPEATLEILSSGGLRISLPDENPNWMQVAFHVNLNEMFRGVEHGHYAEDVLRKTNGRWTLELPQLRAKQGDVIYYWINVIENNNQGYNALFREYRVGGGGSSPNPPATTEEPGWQPEDDVEVIPPALKGKKKPKRF